MSKPRIVIVIGDGQLQRVATNIDGFEVLLLDADSEDDGTELIDGVRFWAGILEPDMDPEYVNCAFDEHCRNKREQYEAQRGFVP